MFEPTVSTELLRLRRPGTRWLSSGWGGGFADGDVAYNISVPEGWSRTDIDDYVASRRTEAGFEETGPTLLTGVDLDHLRGARSGPVEVYATAGISNPAALPIEGSGREHSADTPDAGTVNLIVGTDRALADGALANLLAVVVEAKAATLLAETGFPGTTTDAVVVGCDPAGEQATFTGSATPIGSAARACTRDAVLASLRSRYANSEYPESVADAAHGVETTADADVFRLCE